MHSASNAMLATKPMDCLCKRRHRKEFILRSNSPWGHCHICTEPDISDRPEWWLDSLDPV